jgi:hypothetical protein
MIVDTHYNSLEANMDLLLVQRLKALSSLLVAMMLVITGTLKG